MLLVLFSKLYGGMRLAQTKANMLILSQLFSSLCAAVFSYLQASLLWAWFVDPRPFFAMILLQTVLIVVWAFVSSGFCKKLFPPESLIFIHGKRPTSGILEKIGENAHSFKIIKRIYAQSSFPAAPNESAIFQVELKKIFAEILETPSDGVILWDLDVATRNSLLKFCYENSIRAYTNPKIADVILMSAEQVHTLDSPLLLINDSSAYFEKQIIKRIIDIALSSVLIILTLPICIACAVAIKMEDKGDIFFVQTRCTKDNKLFKIIKFRSMRQDAESDGMPKMAEIDDDRVTAVGRFIRRLRIDELPQLLNILRGEMSFIGPRPERPEIIEQITKQMPEFAFRTKVKAGLAGYAQVFGKYNTQAIDKLKLDLYYIENHSILLDLKLILLTLKVMFSPQASQGVKPCCDNEFHTESDLIKFIPGQLRLSAGTKGQS